MAPNRKHATTLLCESSFDAAQDYLHAVVHPKAAVATQQIRQEQQQQRQVNSDSSYWEWVSPEVEEESSFAAVQEKPSTAVDLFSADHILSKLVAAASPGSTASTESAAAATLASSDDYWAEGEFACTSAEEENSPVPQHHIAPTSPDLYWQWGQEPTESDDYWRPERQQPSKRQSSTTPAVIAASDYYYWNEEPPPTATIVEEEIQGFCQWSTEPPAESEESYWNWKTPTTMQQRTVVRA